MQCFVSRFLAGIVLGDLHFVTFDGLSYTFSGRGEFHLVSSPDKELSVQVRTEQVKPKNGESTFDLKAPSDSFKRNVFQGLLFIYLFIFFCNQLQDWLPASWLCPDILTVAFLPEFCLSSFACTPCCLLHSSENKWYQLVPSCFLSVSLGVTCGKEEQMFAS